MRLFKARASVINDENEMTFGQILAVLLLLAPLIPIGWALIVFIRRTHRPEGHDGTVILHMWHFFWHISLLTTSKVSEEHHTATTAPYPRAVSVNDGLAEPPWLLRDYYTTNWMAGSVLVAEFQIIFYTGVFISYPVSSKESALSIFWGFIGWFFITQPIFTYCYILLGVISEGCETGHNLERLEQRFWSKLPRTAQNFHSLKHFIIYPIILCLFSCVSLFNTNIYAFLVGISGLCVSYYIIWRTL